MIPLPQNIRAEQKCWSLITPCWAQLNFRHINDFLGIIQMFKWRQVVQYCNKLGVHSTKASIPRICFLPVCGDLAVCCEASYYLFYLISQLSYSGTVHGLSYMAELASGNSSQPQSQECALNLSVDQTLHKNFYSSDYWSCSPWLPLPQRSENWLGVSWMNS